MISYRIPRKQVAKEREERKEKARVSSKKWRDNNRDAARMSWKKYRDANKNRRLIAIKQWRKDNPEKAKAIERKAYAHNRTKRLEGRRRQYLKNPERSKANSLAWARANPGKRHAILYKRRTQQRLGNPYTAHDVKQLHLAQKDRCQ